MKSKTVAAGGIATLAAVGGGAVLEGWTIPTNLAEVGGWSLFLGFLVFSVMAIYKGWLVPKPYYDAEKSRAEAAEGANVRLSERAALLTETNNVQARTINKSAEAEETMIKVMSALQEARETRDVPAGGAG